MARTLEFRHKNIHQPYIRDTHIGSGIIYHFLRGETRVGFSKKTCPRHTTPCQSQTFVYSGNVIISQITKLWQYYQQIATAMVPNSCSGHFDTRLICWTILSQMLLLMVLVTIQNLGESFFLSVTNCHVAMFSVMLIVHTRC